MTTRTLPPHSAVIPSRRRRSAAAAWTLLLGIFAAAASPAAGQVAGLKSTAPILTPGAQISRADLQTPITLERLPRLVVTLRGRILLDETGNYPVDGGGGDLRGPGCPPVTSTHTDASFGGGSYVVQAGFAQSEIAAASYSIPAISFPAKFEMAEAIFATSGATQQTTTQWSIIVYDGNPSTGPIVYEESSLEGILPPIILGPGTNGVNVQVVVDPGDPEQVFFTNPQGTNVVSVGFRVDMHHAQGGNPCISGPPTCCNAFPVTDTSGLSQASRNWLRGVNCGTFGCPPNGGWTTFQSLATLCRPTGDWVMRMTWSPVNCAPASGACCLPNGTCDIRSEAQCAQAGGTYRGNGTDCATANCPPPLGACCFGTSCLNLSEADCANAAGTWLGAGVACSQGNTCPTGACCLPDGSCEIRSEASCVASGGIFRGVGAVCGTANCPQPSGACCLANGSCLLLTAADCAIIPGSAWAGGGTTCATGCTCPADWNEDTLVNSGDISAFLTSWLASVQVPDLVADFNGDGVTNSGDISSFLTEWLDVVVNGC